ncbi:S49 family peptidase [Pseudomonas putida]|uniref:S49 family peptidase n=1 Tax=Pseudomonas putida TaxID=303 RepID=UPI0018E68DB3|nr:S49 family peptidase [Pseudomonas putida]MBI6944211.1 S49 family peptidase [Pseudomonas putida]MBI6960312.1 S49 family peptidase [Pseudomonas putida]
MTPFPLLAQRLFNTPIAIRPEKAEIVMGALADRLGIAHLAHLGGEAIKLAKPAMLADDDGYDYSPRERRADKGYDLVGPIAVIPVHGTLVKKLGRLRPYSGMTGYDGIRQAFLTALGDKDVKAIMLDVDSPGGEVAGCFDLVDTIYNARGTKPIWAILNEGAYSAAYAIASAADRIVVPRTGGVGSIGVIVMHVDMSKALGNQGLRVTFITYGDAKADGHAEIPLSAEAAERIQIEVNEMGELFVVTVSRNRALPASKIRATQAATYMAAAGVKLGLADAVMAPDAAFRELVALVA